jgi:type III secretion system FlhB-like substrate exporter
MVLYNAELKIFQDQGTALTSCVLTWSLGKVIPEDLYANMTVLQILNFNINLA